MDEGELKILGCVCRMEDKVLYVSVVMKMISLCVLCEYGSEARVCIVLVCPTSPTAPLYPFYYRLFTDNGSETHELVPNKYCLVGHHSRRECQFTFQ